MSDFDLLFVSPHADDVVFSAGATLALLARQGVRVTVATLFTGGPEAAMRRAEDQAAIAHLGAGRIDLAFDDLIARRRVDRFFETRDEDRALIPKVTQALLSIAGNKPVVGPLGVALHPDHQITHVACAALPGEVSFYEEVPYALCPLQTERRLGQLAGETVPPIPAWTDRMRIMRWWAARPILAEVVARPIVPIAAWVAAGGPSPSAHPLALTEVRRDVSATMDIKMEAIARYATQWPRFYSSLSQFRAALAAHSRQIGSPFITEREFRRQPVPIAAARTMPH